MDTLAYLHPRSARRWVPLALSILIHAGLIAGLIYGYRSYSSRSESTDERRATVADALLVEGGKVGGVSAPSIAANSAVASPAQNLISFLPPKQAHPIDSPPALMGSGIGASSDSQPLIGLPSAAPAESVGIAPEATPAGPPANFMGISGDAVRIVFVCDASGSMMDRLPSLEAQLKYSIDQLQPIQWFNVIFFQDSNAVAISRKNLIQALPTNRDRVEKLLAGVQARGTSNPLTALRLAFSQHPQVIYLLTDGDFEDVDGSVTDKQIVDEIRRLNPRQQAHVNTILFISDAADLEQQDARAGQAVLKRIAGGNDGTFKTVVAEPQ